jgi:Zn finger protein HypA/HybF involved in hydrogenase expression
MVINNSTVDPYSPSRGYFECLVCGSRTTSETRLTECPECAGSVQNIAVPRE